MVSTLHWVQSRRVGLGKMVTLTIGSFMLGCTITAGKAFSPSKPPLVLEGKSRVICLRGAPTLGSFYAALQESRGIQGLGSPLQNGDGEAGTREEQEFCEYSLRG